LRGKCRNNVGISL